jgi:acetylornithine deacetylase/succinyl-diaminopimelate desuccinylase-like protein
MGYVAASDSRVNAEIVHQEHFPINPLKKGGRSPAYLFKYYKYQKFIILILRDIYNNMFRDFMNTLHSWYQQHKETILKDFCSLLRFPSISNNPKHKQDMLSCVQWILRYLQTSGFHTELLATTKYPLIYMEEIRKKDLPTMLIYGHYDVQPADPLEQWHSDPFQPRIDHNHVFARGAQDNKGQLMYVLAALRAFKQLYHVFPINIKLIVEGEEETASEGLAESLQHYREKFSADYLAVVDMEIPSATTPAVTLGCRGLAAWTITIKNASIDLHSGQHGGIAYNPNIALVHLLSKLWDMNNKIQVPHFYDDIRVLSEEEKQCIDFSFDPEAYKNTFGVTTFWENSPEKIRESNWIRPTLEINGLIGGYYGPGIKTVIPQQALAKLSCRLVPDQDPIKIAKNVKKFLQSEAIPGMKINIEEHGKGRAVITDIHSPFVEIVSQVYQEVFAQPCKKVLSGGSVPIIGQLADVLHLDVVFMGVGLVEDKIHAPNENFSLHRLEQGFYIMMRLFEKSKDLTC